MEICIIYSSGARLHKCANICITFKYFGSKYVTMNQAAIISRSINAIKEHPKFLLPYLGLIVASVFIGIFVAVAVIIYLSTSASSSTVSMHILSVIITLLPLFILAAAFIFLVYVYLNGVYISMASLYVANGNPSITKALSASAARFKDLLILEIIVSFAYLLSAIVILYPVIGPAQSLISAIQSGAGHIMAHLLEFVSYSFMFGIIYIAVAIVLSILFFVAPPMVVLGKKGPIDALRESINIGKNNCMYIFILLLLSFLVILAVDLIIAVFSIIPLLGTIINLILSMFIGVFSMLIAPIYYLSLMKKLK